MQFPRAPRFVEKAPSGVPGPGSYNPRSPQGTEKKGLLNVVQAERFDSKENNNPSTFGMYSEKDNQAPATARKRIVSSSQTIDNAARERHKQQLEELKIRMNQQHDKELSKLQAKLAKYESSREELMKEKNENNKEVASLKNEIRHLSSKLTKTESLLEKHQTSLPLLQSKLTSLQTSHEQSRQRKESEISSVRTQLEQLESSYQSKLKECREFEEIWGLERDGRQLEMRVAERVIRELKDEVREVRVVELTRERFARAKVERQLQDRFAQVESLVEYSKGLEETVNGLEAQVKSLLEDNARIFELWNVDRGLLVNERNEKEWRQRARSDMRESAGLAEELESAREEAGIVKEVEKSGETVWKMRRREWKEEKEKMAADYEVVEEELDLAVNEEIPRLESEIDSLTSRLEDQVTHATSLETDLSNLVQESAESTERFEGEIEEQKRIIDTKAKELEKERADKRRVVGLLVQSRAAETALREQVEELTSQLRTLAPLTSEHSSLQQTVDHLARINAATEQDLHDLIDQNAELAGHSNQNQKIKHVASLREELIESKRKHLSTISLLTAAQNKVKNLEQELNSYRAVPVSSHAPPPSARSRVSRPNIDDVEPPTPHQLLQQQQQRQSQAQSRSASQTTIPTITTSAPSSLPPIPRAPNRPPRSFRASVTPTSSTLSTLTEDEPLLPPILAKSASSFLSAPHHQPLSSQQQQQQHRQGGLIVRDARRRRSEMSLGGAEKMEGRMSVSELFN
ncbi:hypothetical protein JCM3765_007037 [Sporobolomyces pararoseus]